MPAPHQAHKGRPKAVLSSKCICALRWHTVGGHWNSGMNGRRRVRRGQHSAAALPALRANSQAGSCLAQCHRPWDEILGSAARCGRCKLHAHHTQAATRRLEKGAGKGSHFGLGPDAQSQMVFTGYRKKNALAQNPPGFCQLPLPSPTSPTSMPSGRWDYRLSTPACTSGLVGASPTCSHLVPRPLSLATGQPPAAPHSQEPCPRREHHPLWFPPGWCPAHCPSPPPSPRPCPRHFRCLGFSLQLLPVSRGNELRPRALWGCPFHAPGLGSLGLGSPPANRRAVQRGSYKSNTQRWRGGRGSGEGTGLARLGAGTWPCLT